MPGIDLLVRSLLANPQVRTVIVDGPTAGPVGEAVKQALFDLWERHDFAPLASDLQVQPKLEHVICVLRHVFLVRASESIPAFPDEDRPGGRLVLSPPTPKASAPAPHGDPGERVAADTLAEVWPQVLQRIMSFGRAVPTQYGETRELLNLVSVIRDPKTSLQEISDCYAQAMGLPDDGPFPHPVLGLTLNQVERYYRESLTGAVPPEGASYTYGSRFEKPSSRKVSITYGGYGALKTVLYADEVCGVSVCDRPLGHTGAHMEGAPDRPTPHLVGGQLEKIKGLLRTNPGTRAAYLTPWDADLDAGVESNRPCLVGVLFRAAGGTLHMTVTFRSHDAFGAYPLNLAGCCLWLTEWARDLGMTVGTLTCVSSSAHVYANSWEKAVVVAGAFKPPVVVWDQRSSWRIERLLVDCLKCRGTGSWKLPQDHDLCLDCDEHDHHLDDDPHCVCGSEFAEDGLCLEPRPDPVYRCGECGASGKIPGGFRATAFTPGPKSDGEVIAVLEAETAGGLRTTIERSGLVSGVGAAMWIGSEIERISRGAP